jgi:DNA-directed RNA polymerase specialized sigma subunit
VQRMQAYAAYADEKEIPQTQRRPAAQPLQRYFDQHPRDVAITQAFLEGGYTQSAIAEVTGLSVSRISRLIKSG